MSTILVTGSEGNIGTYIVRRFSEKYPEAKIIRVGRKPRPAENYYAGDLRRADFVDKIFAQHQIDYVIHTAAETYDAAIYKSSPYDIFAGDVLSLLNVLNASRRSKKFVFLSSASVYEGSSQVPFKEELTSKIGFPTSPVGQSKFCGERAVTAFSKQYGVPYTIWRAFNVVSPLEPHLGSGGHVFVDFYRKLFVQQVKEIEIAGSGRQIRCFTWVEDLAWGVADFLHDNRTDNQVFNLGSTQETALADLVELLVSLGKKNNLLPKDYKPKIITGGEFHGVDSKTRIPDTSKAREILQWQSQTDVRNCFEKFIKAKAIQP
ncbi:MAG: NAD(P)-dependent oxidoreductase [bacterium]|nr:NAD(P)-dependent oxidoreductase [bacterium]